MARTSTSGSKRTKPTTPTTPTHFRTAALFRRWLERHQATRKELIVGFYKKDSGRGGLTYPEALDEALCFGWIDGVRRSVDDASFSIRFTPRRPKSYWSAVNIRKAQALLKSGRMHATGIAAYQRRDASTARAYSFENRPRKLPPAYERAFRANAAAWQWFQGRPPGFQRMMMFWVMSAKQEATRLRRLTSLIESSAAGRLPPPARVPSAADSDGRPKRR